MTSEGLKRLAPRLLFTASLAGGCIWYLWDAASQSTNTANLLLLLPATVIAVILSVAVIVEDVVAWRRSQKAEDGEGEDKLDLRIPILMGLVGLYTLVIVTVGAVDVATLVFVAVTLTLLGERRSWVIVLYSMVFTALVVSGLKVALTYEVSTLLW